MVKMKTSTSLPTAPSASPGWPPVLLVGRGRNGGWLVQDVNGAIGGQFRSRKAALSFAKSESRFRLGRVIEVPAI
ncbi:hypothetical protein ACRAWG_36535 [Methylobacterium sp. P31]